MHAFKTYHPIVNFTYFVFVIGFSCFLMHPVHLLISLFSGFTYSVMLKGKKQAGRNLISMISMLLLMGLFNSAFNHEGVTTLAYFPSGNPLTLEAILYGLFAGTMIVSVICHFSSYNAVMTSDKFMYLFGKIMPAMSLVISMTLRFVPRFSAQLKEVRTAQKCMGQAIGGRNFFRRIRHGLAVLSIMTTWALENSIETADSMKARGYGIPERTAFSVYKFDRRDKKALICILFLGMYTLFGAIWGSTYFSFFPVLRMSAVSPFGISVFAAQFLLFMCPVIIDVWEVRKWKALSSKI
ncbi:MAG: energy-coupling factor transporter transmembrane protein EcfT [Clostridia bacterium]|nr:energy-coupling factor transporter transmembrane protein EcfT [Clostridia bacterium]